MLMPGRTLSSDAYRFGFNGKENLNEVKGVGNTQDYGARIYDSRLSRWLSLDPHFKKYPEISAYSSFENNPTAIVDPGGDTTVYFSQSGKHLFTSFDKIPAAVTIVNDNMLKLLIGSLISSSKNKSQNDNFKNLQFRTYGKTYDINAYRQFYNSNTVDGIDNISPGSKSGFNDPGYYNESRVYNYQKNSLIKPGSKVAKGTIDSVDSYPEKENDKGEIVGKAHTHPNEGKSAGIGPYEYNPSPDDIAHQFENDVIIGNKNIYFYGKNKPVITIDKSTLKPILNDKK